MLQSATLEIAFKFPLNVVGQYCALGRQLFDEFWVVPFDELVELRLFGPVALMLEITLPVRTRIVDTHSIPLS